MTEMLGKTVGHSIVMFISRLQAVLIDHLFILFRIPRYRRNTIGRASSVIYVFDHMSNFKIVDYKFYRKEGFMVSPITVTPYVVVVDANSVMHINNVIIRNRHIKYPIKTSHSNPVVGRKYVVELKEKWY